MRENWLIALVGARVKLIPYRRVHVPKYHRWMKDTDLLSQTGSEPLSLDEEYHMQQTWRDSEDKCTFIILDKAVLDGGANEIDAMVGDTNLFLRRDNDDGENLAEVEIMIAEKAARGRRLGWEAVAMMMRYGREELGVGLFEAKVKDGNEPSHAMFAKLGFVKEGRSEVFQEVTYRMRVGEEEGEPRRDFLWEQTKGRAVETYVHQDGVEEV